MVTVSDIAMMRAHLKTCRDRGVHDWPGYLEDALYTVEKLRAALNAEIEQHEAFYIQSGIKSEVHETGIAAARDLLT